MPRNSKVGKKPQRSSPSRSSGAGGRVRRGRPKVCVFCAQQATWVDYKDITVLRRFLSDRGKIKSRGSTGNCAQHQRDVAVAIKTAREVALLPYVVRSVSAEPGDRRGPRGRPGGAGSRGADATPASEAENDTSPTDGEPALEDGEPETESADLDRASDL